MDNISLLCQKQMETSLSLYRLLRTQPRSVSKWESVRARVLRFPGEVIPLVPASPSPIIVRMSGGDRSSYPLHDSIRFGAPIDIIISFIRMFPAALKIRDDWDHTPLDIALYINAEYQHDHESWLTLLELLFNETCVYYLNANQRQSINIGWGSCKTWDNFANPRFIGQLDCQPEKLRAITFRANFIKVLKNEMTPNDELERFIKGWKLELKTVWRQSLKAKTPMCLLHACLTTNCNLELVQLAHKLQPSCGFSTKTQDGDLPLHLACSNFSLNGGLEDFYLNDGISSDSLLRIHLRNEVLEYVVSMYRGGASSHNNAGFLALHMALHHGKTWRSGVSHIVEAYPSALDTLCPESSLVPFMIAATKATSLDVKELWKNRIDQFVSDGYDTEEIFRKDFTARCLNEVHSEYLSTIYMLLRESPLAIYSSTPI